MASENGLGPGFSPSGPSTLAWQVSGIEQRVQPIHLAVLLGLNQALRDILRWRCRKGATCGHQSYSQGGQEMAAIELGHAFLPRGTMRACRSASLTKRWRTAVSN